MHKCASYKGSSFQAELMLLGYYLSHCIMVYLLVVLLMMCVWQINLIDFDKRTRRDVKRHMTLRSSGASSVSGTHCSTTEGLVCRYHIPKRYKTLKTLVNTRPR